MNTDELLAQVRTAAYAARNNGATRNKATRELVAAVAALDLAITTGQTKPVDWLPVGSR